MNKQELKARSRKFGLGGLHLVDSLPNTPTGRAIGSQLIRSGQRFVDHFGGITEMVEIGKGKNC